MRSVPPPPPIDDEDDEPLLEEASGSGLFPLPSEEAGPSFPDRTEVCPAPLPDDDLADDGGDPGAAFLPSDPPPLPRPPVRRASATGDLTATPSTPPARAVLGLGLARWQLAVVVGALGFAVIVLVLVLVFGSFGSAPPAPPPVAEPAVAEPAALRPPPAARQDCRPFSAWPAVPFADHLNPLILAAKTDRPCGLFGVGTATIVAALKDLPQIGPGGFDLVDTGELFEVFPGGKADRRAASIELVLSFGRLIELRINEPIAAGSPDRLAEELARKLGPAAEEHGQVGAARHLLVYRDGDLEVERLTRTANGQIWRSLILGSRVVRQAVSPAAAVRRAGEAALDAGEAEFAARRWDGALTRYAEARRQIPGLGLAMVKAAIVLVRQERFADAEKLALETIEKSREIRSRASAEGILGVVGLSRGRRAEAISRFHAAASLDPADPLFGMSAHELESGEYAGYRVAITAARLECLAQKKGPGTEVGILARGNFPSRAAFDTASARARKTRGFGKLVDSYLAAECR